MYETNSVVTTGATVVPGRHRGVVSATRRTSPFAALLGESRNRTSSADHHQKRLATLIPDRISFVIADQLAFVIGSAADACDARSHLRVGEERDLADDEAAEHPIARARSTTGRRGRQIDVNVAVHARQRRLERAGRHRAGALEAPHLLFLADEFLASLNFGLENLDAICKESATEMSLPEKELKLYLKTNIDYSLDDENRKGLLAYYSHAVKLGLIEKLNPITIAARTGVPVRTIDFSWAKVPSKM